MELVLLVLIVILFYMIIKTIKEAIEKRSKSSFDIKMYNDKVEKPQHAKPKLMRVVDMLIYPTNVRKAQFEIYPVLKDQITNEIYVSFASHGYGKYYYHYYKNKKRIEIMKANGKVLEKHEEATLYLTKEIGKIIVDKNKVMIGGKEYKYVGQMNKKNIKIRKKRLYNLSSEKFLNDIHLATYYDGYVEF